ncbi:hypothetical protein CspeluHIS016_0104660 [Cutaneotrichosporon spelunceum]|uniref:WW domain-containing protein n=1 Tax=Cutaneotrichosporon spelunceum TaxID=1672016 RepID=A0AAD3TNF0_9TREE|nr:hypothetical protein CspeluHIS016_0104660 [Cutaneotrichosporon spelunceum]
MDDADVDWGLDDDGYDDDCLSVGGYDDEMADEPKTKHEQDSQEAIKRNESRGSPSKNIAEKEEASKTVKDIPEAMPEEEPKEGAKEAANTARQFQPKPLYTNIPASSTEPIPSPTSAPLTRSTPELPVTSHLENQEERREGEPPSSQPRDSAGRDRRARSREREGWREDRRDKHEGERPQQEWGDRSRPTQERRKSYDRSRPDDKHTSSGREGRDWDERREVKREHDRAVWRGKEPTSLRTEDGYHLKGAFQQPLHNSTDGLPGGWRRIVPDKAFREGIPIPTAPKGGPGRYFFLHEGTGAGQWEAPAGSLQPKPEKEDRKEDTDKLALQDRPPTRPAATRAVPATSTLSSRAPTGPRAVRQREPPKERDDRNDRGVRDRERERREPERDGHQRDVRQRGDGPGDRDRRDEWPDDRNGRRDDRREDRRDQDRRERGDRDRRRGGHDDELSRRDNDRSTQRDTDERPPRREEPPAFVSNANFNSASAPLGPRMNESREAMLNGSDRPVPRRAPEPPRPAFGPGRRVPPGARAPIAARLAPAPAGPPARRGMRAWGQPESIPRVPASGPPPREFASAQRNVRERDHHHQSDNQPRETREPHGQPREPPRELAKRDESPKPREEPRRSEKAEALRAQLQESRRARDEERTPIGNREERKEPGTQAAENRKCELADEGERHDNRRQPVDRSNDRENPNELRAVPVHPSRMGLIPTTARITAHSGPESRSDHSQGSQRPMLDLASRLSDRGPHREEEKPNLASRISGLPDRVDEHTDWKPREGQEPPNERAARPYTPQESLTSPIPGQGCTLPAQRWFLLDLHGNRADRCRNPKGLSAIASATIPSDAVLRAACLHMGQTHVSEMVTASATPTAAQNVMIVTAIAFLKVVAAAPSVTLRPMGPTLAARPALQGVGVTTARVRQRTMSAAVRNGMTEA